MSDGYEPTDSECEIIDRAGMRAAFLHLNTLDDIDEQPIAKGVYICLKAFSASRQARKEAEKKLLSNNPGYRYVNHLTSDTNIVCSALVASLLQVEPEEVHPNSIAGQNIATFINAAMVLDSISQIHSALYDDSDIFGTYLAEEAACLASGAVK